MLFVLFIQHFFAWSYLTESSFPIAARIKPTHLIDRARPNIMSPKSQIELVPWDSESPNHLDRLVEQRVQCGWHEGKVKTSWRDEQREGTKCIYWIVRELILEISPVDSSHHFRLFRLEIQNKPRNSISISRNIQEFVSNPNTKTLYLIKT